MLKTIILMMDEFIRLLAEQTKQGLQTLFSDPGGKRLFDQVKIDKVEFYCRRCYDGDPFEFGAHVFMTQPREREEKVWSGQTELFALFEPWFWRGKARVSECPDCRWKTQVVFRLTLEEGERVELHFSWKEEEKGNQARRVQVTHHGETPVVLPSRVVGLEVAVMVEELALELASDTVQAAALLTASARARREAEMEVTFKEDEVVASERSARGDGTGKTRLPRHSHHSPAATATKAVA